MKRRVLLCKYVPIFDNPDKRGAYEILEQQGNKYLGILVPRLCETEFERLFPDCKLEVGETKQIEIEIRVVEGG